MRIIPDIESNGNYIWIYISENRCSMSLTQHPSRDSVENQALIKNSAVLEKAQTFSLSRASMSLCHPIFLSSDSMIDSHEHGPLIDLSSASSVITW